MHVLYTQYHLLSRLFLLKFVAINTTMPIYSIDAKVIEFELLLIKGVNWPTFTLNHDYTSTIEYENDNTKQIKITVHNPNTEIIFTYSNKTRNDVIINNGEIVLNQCVLIKKIWINEILIDINLLNDNFCFYPKYDIYYIAKCKRENVELEKVIHTVELFHNGELHFNYTQPFFQWYNQKHLDIFKKVNNWFKQNNLGIADTDKISKLKKMLDLLNK